MRDQNARDGDDRTRAPMEEGLLREAICKGLNSVP